MKTFKRINLINGYFVDIDEYSYNLKSSLQKKVKKEGKNKGEQYESYKLHGHFTTWESLFKKLHNIISIDNLENGGEIKDIKIATEKAHKTIEKLVERLGV